jgi:hypothetical protein
MVSGWAISRFQASQPASVSKTRFDSQFWRRYCQTFSTGLSSGERDGSRMQTASGRHATRLQTGDGPYIFKGVEHALVLARMLRPAADVGEGEACQQIGDGALAVDDAEALLDHPLQIDAPPAHHAVDRRVGPGLDDLGELVHLRLAQPSAAAGGGAVCQALRSFGVEAMRPVAQGLAVHAADLGCLGAAHPVINGGQRQQPSGLADIAAAPGQRAELGGVIIVSKRNLFR